MSDVRKHLEESLKDPEFKQEWDAQAAEREAMRQVVEARKDAGATQAELAEACSMKPVNLCRFEYGNGNLSPPR